MQTEAFTSFQCWDSGRIGQVINKEAASVDKATFLTTHMPMNMLNYKKEPQKIEDTSEQGLLHELRSAEDEDRHVFAVIQGAPGTGKSHLIRWLKERYAVEEGAQTKVLFIERAQGTLSGTLDQIIKSGIFDVKAMREHLEKLKGATIALSHNTLAETVLDQLRLAATEEQSLMAKWMAKNEKLKKFLLDVTVRRELLKPSGPIDRLVRFLTQRSHEGRRSDELPTFEAHDFEFHVNVLYEIKSGYAEALDVAQRLQGEDEQEKREELATYLNQFIPHAVGHATSLTGDDLKQLFNDLRRYLRLHNYNLALFIEDITAFTGIDVGLIDVLATQHLGSANSEFCRLSSVIGITDNYYDAHFPDNLKDRVTHRVTLDAIHYRETDAELLTNASATADLSVRYLNAMRLQHSQLDDWLEHGGHPEQLPNACDGCRFNETCHAAFGYKEVAVGQEQSIRIGLYPFNEHAIWQLYQHINTTYTKRTPRSLLNDVLSYVLQSYGSKIRQGLFPPTTNELGNRFTTFSLAKPLQRQLIEQQAGRDVKRIESLILIWGNGTIDVNQSGTDTYIGGLAQEVFKAFSLRPIAGETVQGQVSQVPSASPTNINRLTSRAASPSTSATSSFQSTSISSTTTTVEAEVQRQLPQKYADDISGWLDGKPLRHYEYYSDLLWPLLRSAINWQFYGVSSLLVDEMLRGRGRIFIEGQVGKINTSYYLTLTRSSKLASVLIALVDLKENGEALPITVMNGHLTNISTWLHQQEARIVQFVSQPNWESTHILPLITIVLLNCLMLACLQGKLNRSYESPERLFLHLIGISKNSAEDVQQVQTVHSPSWSSLTKRMQASTEQYRMLLGLLNRAQGDSSDVRFIDADVAITILARFQKRDWKLEPSGLVGTTVTPYWDKALKAYEILQNHFAGVLHADQDAIKQLLDKFDELLGSSSLEEVFQEMRNFVEFMRSKQRAIDFSLKSAFTPQNANTMLNELQNIVQETRIKRLALRLSSAEPLLVRANAYLSYFEVFQKEVTAQQKQAEKQREQLRTRLDSMDILEITQVNAAYKEIEGLLSHSQENV
ncbi:MAG TPA: hypothetical protein VNG51_26195 [Ktedonobacteraceae bacterium]|nr:hypothetical protein [Ktedonobacteraceae bacterium]